MKDLVQGPKEGTWCVCGIRKLVWLEWNEGMSSRKLGQKSKGGGHRSQSTL